MKYVFGPVPSRRLGRSLGIMVGTAPSRYSHGIVKETGVFMANLVTESMRPVFDYLVSHEIFVGKIERVHADEGLVDAEVMFDWSKIEFLKLQGRAA